MALESMSVEVMAKSKDLEEPVEAFTMTASSLWVHEPHTYTEASLVVPTRMLYRKDVGMALLEQLITRVTTYSTQTTADTIATRSPTSV